MCACLVLGLAASSAPAAEDPAASMYEASHVNVIYLTLSSVEEAKLKAEPKEYVKGTFSFAETDGTPSGIGAPSTPIPVEIHLKGDASFRSLAQKAAFKLKFKKTERFRGLRKMTLNNMVQDPSQVHEATAYTLFRAAGVKASRAGFAYVYLNGVDYGMHLNLETLDEVSLEERFGPFQHLYEAELGTDVKTGSADTAAEVTAAADKFEIDEGDEKDVSDLEALIHTVNESNPADWSTRVEPLADLKEMTREWAVEKYIGHWDGYAGQEGQYWPNNYYLMSETGGRFLMIPSGVDQTFGVHLGFAAPAGVLFNRCLADPSCDAMYVRSLRELQTAVPGAGLDPLVTSIATLLRPWQEMEMSNGARHEHSLSEIESAVTATHAFIGQRPGELTAFLGGQPVEVPAAHVTVAVSPSLLPGDGKTAAAVTATVTDAAGDPIPGDHVSFASTDPGEGISPVVDHDNGIYTAVVTASSGASEATITATDSTPSAPIKGTATLTQVGPVAKVTVTVDPGSISAGGTTATTATAKVGDALGTPILGDEVVFTSSDPGEIIGPVTNHGDGTYSVRILPSATVGSATITATNRSSNPTVSGTAQLTQTGVAKTGMGQAPAPGGPTVAILGKRLGSTLDRTPTFRFAADGATGFECRIGSKPFKPCTSPYRPRRLAFGRHVFAVRAVNDADVGPAAIEKFVVKRRVAAHGSRR